MTLVQLATYAIVFLCGLLAGAWMVYDAVLDTIRSRGPVLIIKKERR